MRVLALCLASAGLSAGLNVFPTSMALRMQRPVLQTAHQQFAMSVEEEEVEAMSEEEYLAELAAQEGMSEEEYLAKGDDNEDSYEDLSEDAKRVYRGMRSASGVEFAPWMKIDAEKIAQAKKEREARKARSSNRSDQMLIDPQAAELGAGGGLKSKVLSEEEVELRWSTGDETGNMGFIVQRRKGGSNNFEDIESYESFAPLKTKGVSGGEYSYLDDTLPGPGTYVYRICDQDATGVRSAICQKLVEIEDASEQTQTLIIGGFIAGLALVLFVAGTLADPLQTTDLGRGF